VDEEAPAIIRDHRPPTSWPELGVIDYDTYSVRYRQSLPLVLRRVTCHIRANEKVGIVGRTGSGELIRCALRSQTQHWHHNERNILTESCLQQCDACRPTDSVGDE